MRQLGLVMTLLMARGGGAAEPLAAAALTDEHVVKAIDALTLALYERKSSRHFWDPPSWDAARDGSATQRGGYTALAVLALLQAGQSYQDPRLADAVEHLTTFEMNGTYAVSLRTSLWARLPPRFEDRLLADAAWLREGYSPRVGGWAYEKRPTTSRRDHSIRQYGALALWAASERGVKVPSAMWTGLEEAFIHTQRPDGGWNYKGDEDPATGSMTAAGLATLYITQDLLHNGAALDKRSSRGATTAADRNQVAIESGLAWMDANFSPTENPGSFRDYYYYLYGVERVGLASGVRQFGGHDWFREGAAELIRRLCAWDDNARTMTVHEKIGGGARGGQIGVRHLAFALLFLSRGRVPIAVNKLALSDIPWNTRPRDAANLARFISQTAEGELAWQVTRPDAMPSSWLDAAFAYVAPDRPLPAPDEDAGRTLAASWRAYLERGGLLFVATGRGGRRVARSVETMGTASYPGATWHSVESDHAFYTRPIRITRGELPLRVLSNGVRPLIVVAASGDLPTTLHGRVENRRPHTETAANVYFYASEMNRPHPRLGMAVRPRPTSLPAPGPVRIARAVGDGFGRAEPLALPAFAEFMTRHRGIDVTVEDHALADIADLEPAPDLVVLQGTEAFPKSSGVRDAIRAIDAKGILVLVEATGGRRVFAETAETQLGNWLAGTFAPLLEHPIVAGQGFTGGVSVTTVTYRPYALEVVGRDSAPRLRHLAGTAGRPRIIVSAEDLTFAQLDRPCWGIVGYATESARDVLANVTLYSASSPP